MLKSKVICTAWAIVFHLLQRMAMFLVGILSMVRAFSLVQPFRRVRKGRVLMVVAGYLGVNLFVDVLLSGGINFYILIQNLLVD